MVIEENWGIPRDRMTELLSDHPDVTAVGSSFGSRPPEAESIQDKEIPYE